MRRIVYCEFGFLQGFIEENPCNKALDFSETGMIKGRNWFQLGLLLMKSSIVFNVTEKEFLKSVVGNDFLEQLWGKRNDGECVLRFSESYKSIDELQSSDGKSDRLDGLFFTMLPVDVCNSMADTYGILCLNLEMALYNSDIYDDFGEAVNAGSSGSWDFLEKHNVSSPTLKVSHSMIIVDNYLLYDKEKIQRNLFPILGHLLPCKLSDELEYHLSIFTTNKDDKLKFRHKYLMEEISRIRPKLNVRITITQCTTADFHDRAIVTNNIWIGIGKGCDLPDKKGKVVQSTTISIHFPFIQTSVKWGEKAWINLLKDAECVFRKNHKKDFDFWGDDEMQNRLIQWFNIAKEQNRK